MGKYGLCWGEAERAKRPAASRRRPNRCLPEQTTPLILLTPEQATYQMEQMVLAYRCEGFSRLRVLSFNRLVFWLNRRLRTGTELSRLGRQMVTYRILLEQAKNLSHSHKAARQPGLARRAPAGCWPNFNRPTALLNRLPNWPSRLARKCPTVRRLENGRI